MEGLYFEASTTTPYHFMMIATLAQSPSNPVRGLPYRSIADFDLGVRYLQLMGVRYYAAFSDAAKAAAAQNPALHPVATVPDLDGKPPSGWTIYRVADSPTVQALDLRTGRRRRPARGAVVEVRGRARAGRDRHRPKPSSARGSAARCRGSTIRPRSTDRSTDGGPSSWKRADAADGTLGEEARPPQGRRCRTSRPPSRRSSSTCRAPGSR